MHKKINRTTKGVYLTGECTRGEVQSANVVLEELQRLRQRNSALLMAPTMLPRRFGEASATLSQRPHVYRLGGGIIGAEWKGMEGNRIEGIDPLWRPNKGNEIKGKETNEYVREGAERIWGRSL